MNDLNTFQSQNCSQLAATCIIQYSCWTQAKPFWQRNSVAQLMTRMCITVQLKGTNCLTQQRSPTRSTTNSAELNAMCYVALPHPPYSLDISPTDFHFTHLDFLYVGVFQNWDATKTPLGDCCHHLPVLCRRYKRACIPLTKNVSMPMVLILIDEIYQNQKYIPLNLRVRNRQDFCNSLNIMCISLSLCMELLLQLTPTY